MDETFWARERGQRGSGVRAGWGLQVPEEEGNTQGRKTLAGHSEARDTGARGYLANTRSDTLCFPPVSD